jgi:general stress protein YciG/CheY-like chemotaxis protein
MADPPNKEAKTKRRGFAAMSPDLHRRLSSRGGRNVDSADRAFTKDRSLAAEAGRKGGAQGYAGAAPKPSGKMPPIMQLAGKRVLVAEDEFLIADEIVSTLERLGARIIGPFPTVQAALQILDHEVIDGAVLDINLRDERVDRLADRLSAMKVPYVFITGYSRSSIPLRYAAIPLFEKPLHAELFANRLVL